MLVDKKFAEKYYSILQVLQPDATIEIGAYDAEFSQRMATVLDGKNVWAFEALPRIYETFKEDLNHINYVNLAVSDGNKKVTFGELPFDKKAGLLSGASSFLQRTEPLDATMIEVDAMTVDSIVEINNIKGKIALWIDCEGANREVLTGAVDTLKNAVSVYIEVENVEVWEGEWLKDDTVQFLVSNGFTCIDESIGTTDIQNDLIFVRNNLVSSLL